MTAAVVVCPDRWLPGDHPAVFLAGGVTGCPDWQTPAAGLLPDGTVAFTPRRPDWPIGDPAASEGQIRWEHQHLAAADVVLFWFCQETVQPIALFELGVHAVGLGRPVAVGCHPAYPRRTDVLVQLGLARPDVPVRDTLEATCADTARLLTAAR